VLVSPEWINPPISPGDVLIRLDQGLTGAIVDGHGLPQTKGWAFGSGIHPSTQLALQILEDFINHGDHVLDLGTGSGILGIAAAQMGAGNVLALDVDDFAVKFARQNVKINAVEHIMRVEQGSIDWLLETSLEPCFDLIIVNITALTVIELLQGGLVTALNPNGMLIFGGFSEKEIIKIEEVQRLIGLKTAEIRKQYQWAAIIAQLNNPDTGAKNQE
jgi:ribosomal protein L11 methyltransferase